MASVYKRASKAQEDPDLSDISMSSDDDNQSSGTLDEDTDGDDSSSETSSNHEQDHSNSKKIAQLPTELRNRILMLTSRGVSYR